MLINCLVYGTDKALDEGLVFLRLLVSYTSLEHIAGYTMKLMGPLIRIANYRLQIERKENVLKLMHHMHQLDLPLKPFFPQLQTTYFKILVEFSREPEALKTVSQCCVDLCKITARKDLVLSECFNKFRDEEAMNSKNA